MEPYEFIRKCGEYLVAMADLHEKCKREPNNPVFPGLGDGVIAMAADLADDAHRPAFIRGFKLIDIAAAVIDHGQV